MTEIKTETSLAPKGDVAGIINRLMLVLLLITLSLSFTAAPAVSAPLSTANIAQSAEPVRIFNRTVLYFRVPVLGVTAAERAERAVGNIGRLLNRGGNGKVSLQVVPQGHAILIDGVLAFVMVPEDADQLTQETPLLAAQNAVKALELVVSETKEAKSFSIMLHAAGISIAATLILLLICWLLHRIRNLVVTKLADFAHSCSTKYTIGGGALVQRDWIFMLVRRSIATGYWLLTLLLVFNWIGFILGRFPYTRPWGEQLTEYLVTGAQEIMHAVITAVPGLIVALLIFMFARFVIRMLNSFLERVEQGEFEFAGLDRDTVVPTKRLIAVAIWLFALAMAYPYLPGSETAAFKGLSVLVGLMISLGGTSLVGQAASGLILVYTRTLRPGEYVQIGSTKGTVVDLGLFATRISTGMGEELTLPNSLILGNITHNYSRVDKGSGFTIEVNLSIGYDTPWRQVESLLLAAAQKIPGIKTEPPPIVFQTRLSDFYIEYRLVCQATPEDPDARALLLNALHTAILDNFNDHEVQIMSPHYLGDPAHPKVVPRNRWFP